VFDVKHRLERHPPYIPPVALAGGRRVRNEVMNTTTVPSRGPDLKDGRETNKRQHAINYFLPLGIQHDVEILEYKGFC
jgi:hypothetical protein